MEQAITDPTILNVDKIRRHLISIGVPENEADDALDDIDIRLNKALATKSNTTDVEKMFNEKLDDVATKEFVRAEIQTIRTEIQINSNKLQWRLMGTMISLATICTMALIFGLPYMLHIMIVNMN